MAGQSRVTRSEVATLPSEASAAARFEIRLLGPFQVLVDGVPIEAGLRGSAARLLAALALHPGLPVARKHVAELFWPDSAGSQARTNLRLAIHALGRSLPGADRWLALRGRALRWHPEAEVEVDVGRFRTTASAATERSLQFAIDLYRGELLQGWKDEWLQSERAELRQVFVRALARLADIQEAAGSYSDAIRCAERLQADDPLGEEHVRRRMRLRALLGDRAGVEAVYRAAAALLRRELNTDPAEQTTELYHRLTTTLQRPTGRPAAKRHGRSHSPVGPARLGDAVEDVESQSFVGRPQELESFRRWLTAADSAGAVLDVFGPGGVGKSTLLRAFARLARKLGWPTLVVDARDISCTPAGLAAGLGASSEGRALARLNRLRPLLLLDTCEELGELDRYLREHLLPRLDPRVRVVMAGRHSLGAAWRLDSPWRRLVFPLPVKGFTNEETDAYLRLRGIADAHLVEQLTEATGGNPLALSLAADLVTRLRISDLRAAEGPWRLTVHDLVNRLLGDVRDEGLRELIEAAAMLRSFDRGSLAAVAGRKPSGATFDVLAHLSVVRPDAHGLMLHDDVRRLVIDDLRWRDPARFATLHLRTLAHVRTRMAAATTFEERAHLFTEHLYLCEGAVVRSVAFEPETPGRIWTEDGRAEDHDDIRRIWQRWLLRVTGAPGDRVLAQALERALRWPGTRLRVARRQDGVLVGFGAVLPICQQSLPILLASPNSAAVLRSRWSEEELRGLPPSADDTRLFFFRYLAHDDREQDSDAVRAALVRDLLPVLSLGGAYYVSVAEQRVKALVEALRFRRLPGSSCLLDGACLTEDGYEIDLIQTGFDAWIDSLVARTAELPQDVAPGGPSR